MKSEPVQVIPDSPVPQEGAVEQSDEPVIVTDIVSEKPEAVPQHSNVVRSQHKVFKKSEATTTEQPTAAKSLPNQVDPQELRKE